MNKLILATGQGVIVCERINSGWDESLRGLINQHVTSITLHGGMILAGTETGIFRSEDEGQTWKEASKGLTTRHVRWTAYHQDADGLVFAGTEPANIFVSHNNGDSWRLCPEVAELRDRFKW